MNGPKVITGSPDDLLASPRTTEANESPEVRVARVRVVERKSGGFVLLRSDPFGLWWLPSSVCGIADLGDEGFLFFKYGRGHRFSPIVK